MSRSLGDAVASRLGVIQDPDVRIHTWNPELEPDAEVVPMFLMLGSDGVWDGLGLSTGMSQGKPPLRDSINEVRALLVGAGRPAPADATGGAGADGDQAAQGACARLMARAWRGMQQLGFDDNLTCVVVQVPHVAWL